MQTWLQRSPLNCGFVNGSGTQVHVRVMPFGPGGDGGERMETC